MKYIYILAVLFCSTTTIAGSLSQCRAIIQTIEDNFLLRGDQRAEIAKIIGQKTSKDIDATVELLKKLPPRGFSADVLDHFRSSSPDEVMMVLRRLVSEDIEPYFLRRGNWQNMTSADRVFFDVVVNSKWKSFASAKFHARLEKIVTTLKISTYIDMLFKNKDRKIGSTYLESFLLDLSNKYTQIVRFSELTLSFDSIAKMRSEIASRVVELRDAEKQASGLKRLHLRKDRATLETYLRLTGENSSRWMQEGKDMLDQQWSATRYRFLTGLFPKSPVLDNLDRAEFLVSSLGIALLLYSLEDRSMEWLHQPTDVIFDEELGFDKEDTVKDLREDEKKFIREQLELGRSLEEIFEEINKSKK